MVGNHVADLVARYGADGDVVPRELTDYVRTRQGYDYAHHGRSGNPDTRFVPDEIVDRFCLIGPAERHVEKLNALRALGVDQFALYAMHDAREAVIDAYGSQVIPAVRGGGSARR
jgi:alkanesulfonate monooxygenase SsuD/methylene tetrahydromethanopterin reductase-like flavin-dependent oxidoreductase (luciferase family)